MLFRRPGKAERELVRFIFRGFHRTSRASKRSSSRLEGTYNEKQILNFHAWQWAKKMYEPKGRLALKTKMRKGAAKREPGAIARQCTTQWLAFVSLASPWLRILQPSFSLLSYPSRQPASFGTLKLWRSRAQRFPSCFAAIVTTLHPTAGIKEKDAEQVYPPLVSLFTTRRFDWNFCNYRKGPGNVYQLPKG